MTNQLHNRFSSIWDEKRDVLTHLFEEQFMKALSFYLVKYPQKSKIFLSDELKYIIDEHNDSHKPEYSILKRMEINFNPFQGVDEK
jgi:hypothetical protein